MCQREQHLQRNNTYRGLKLFQMVEPLHTGVTGGTGGGGLSCSHSEQEEQERAGVEWLQPSQRAKASEVPTNKG